MENVHNILKKTLTKFLDNNNLEWDELLLFACYCYNIFQGSNDTESPFSLCLNDTQQKEAYLTLTIAIGIMELMKEILVWRNVTNYGSTIPNISKEWVKEINT